MKIEGEHIFNGTQRQVWDLFRDTEVMAAALPGTKKMELVDENTYEAVMFVRVGPVAGEFSGQLVISNEDYPRQYTMTVEGRGKPGFMKGVGDVTLVDLDGNQTRMEYQGEVQVGGRLAAVGQRLVDTVAKSIISQAFETLDAVLAERISASVEGREASYQAASQGDFVSAVTRDILSEPWVKWALGAVLLIVLIAVIMIILL
mgnify:CR=1 FL=1